MDPAELAVDPDEVRRLAECAREPIRTPGAVQSFGTLLGVDADTGRVVVASEDAADWLGRDLAEVGDPVLDYAARTGTAVDPVRVEWRGVPADAIVHRVGEVAIVEIEPLFAGEYARTPVVAAIQRLSTLTSTAELLRVAAEEIRTITGYDRVMIHRFHDDGHGEVVAESAAPGAESYLGLHFPSSDIPPQARELYVSKLSRQIADSSDAAVPLVALEVDPASIDLSAAELRAVSPYHLQYMRNMGQAATVSFSLVEHGRLVGMITCAHGEPRRLPPLLRRSLEVLANQVTMQVSSMRQIESLRRTVEVRERRAELLAPLYGSDDVVRALLDGSRTVLDLIPAAGVLVRIGGVTRVAGEVPDRAALERVLDDWDGAPMAIECLERERPDLAALLPDLAGLLVVPIDGRPAAGAVVEPDPVGEEVEPPDVLVFTRRELAREVSWLGDPGIGSRPDGMSPRTSFSAWRQSVRGRSEPWGDAVAESRELAEELAVALHRRAEAKLAELAMRDPLTGLYNRRYLVDRLSTRGPVGPQGKSVLFVDLDEFKLVNDEFGHDVGDEVILAVARRLTAHSRVQDVVIRLGGDEFVVLCDGAQGDDAAAIAERIVEAVSVPIVVGSRVVEVTASCGIVVAAPGTPREGLLEAADAAMYRAKRAGRNRISD